MCVCLFACVFRRECTGLRGYIRTHSDEQDARREHMSFLNTAVRSGLYGTIAFCFAGWLARRYILARFCGSVWLGGISWLGSISMLRFVARSLKDPVPMKVNHMLLSLLVCLLFVFVLRSLQMATAKS